LFTSQSDQDPSAPARSRRSLRITPIYFRQCLETPLETNVRTKRHAQIVASATAPVDFVSNIQTHSYRTHVPFESAAWIKHALHVAALQVIHAVEEVSYRRR